MQLPRAAAGSAGLCSEADRSRGLRYALAASLPTALALASALPASPVPPQDGKIDFKEFCDLIRKYPCD